MLPLACLGLRALQSFVGLIMLLALGLSLVGCSEPQKQPADLRESASESAKAPFGVFDIQAGHGHGHWRDSTRGMAR